MCSSLQSVKRLLSPGNSRDTLTRADGNASSLSFCRSLLGRLALVFFIAAVLSDCFVSRQAWPPHSKGLLREGCHSSRASTVTHQPGPRLRPEGAGAWGQRRPLQSQQRPLPWRYFTDVDYPSDLIKTQSPVSYSDALMGILSACRDLQETRYVCAHGAPCNRQRFSARCAL